MNHIMPRLSLAYKELRALPQNLAAQFGQACIELDLSHNNFRSLRSLAGFAFLETLILDHNEIDHHVVFQHHPLLSTLWVNHNNIGNLPLFIGQVVLLQRLILLDAETHHR